MSTTWGELKEELIEEMSLEDDNRVSPREMLAYCHEALKEAEAEIHKLSIEDQYFESMSVIPVSANKRDYAFPNDIYANKITRIVFSESERIYAIKRLTNLKRYQDAEFITKHSSTTDYFNYIILNNSKTSGPRIRLIPTPVSSVLSFKIGIQVVEGESQFKLTDPSFASMIRPNFIINSESFPEGTSVEGVSGDIVFVSEASLETNLSSMVEVTEDKFQIFYIRNVYLPEDDCDVIDIPEFSNFVKQYIRTMIVKKEILNPTLPAEEAKLLGLRTLMVDTLTEMVPDQDDTIEPDISIYRWSS